MYVLRNLTKANKESAASIVQTDLMDVLFAIKATKDSQLVNEKVNGIRHGNKFLSKICRDLSKHLDFLLIAFNTY